MYEGPARRVAANGIAVMPKYYKLKNPQQRKYNKNRADSQHGYDGGN
jgi:hypothetical protein